MTNIEMETLALAKTALRKHIADEIDWEQRRYEIAKDVMASMMSEYRELEFKKDEETCLIGELTDHYRLYFSLFAKASVFAADALIKELKGGKPCE